MYKIFFLFAVAALGSCSPAPADQAHLTPEQSAKLLQNSMQCIGETGVSPDAIVQVRSGKFSDDEKFQKFLYCVLRKSGIASKDGHVKVDKALDKYPKNVDKEAIKKVMEECNKENGKNPVDTSFKVFKCFHAKTPVHLSL